MSRTHVVIMIRDAGLRAGLTDGGDGGHETVPPENDAVAVGHDSHSGFHLDVAVTSYLFFQGVYQLALP